LCEAESVINRHGDRSALPLPVKCLGQYYCNFVWQTSGLIMAGCRRLILHWNYVETSSVRVNSTQLHQPSLFFHAPTWRHQIEDLGKDRRIILQCNLNLELRHLRCVSNNEVEYNGNHNTTSLLARYSFGVNETTCFGLLRGHHQVYNVGYRRLILMRACAVRC
jgi:hypothetical protein